jgi:hypothetical protein
MMQILKPLRNHYLRQEENKMLKFYVVKRDEREGDGYKGVVDFESAEQLERWLSYHRGYIEELRTIGEVVA